MIDRSLCPLCLEWFAPLPAPRLYLRIHFTHQTGESLFFYKGAKINFFQGVGDPRLARITNDITASKPAYSLTHTSENNGDQGVIRGTITDISSELSYDGMIRRRVPITMEIEHD